MAKLTLNNFESGYASNSALNANNDLIEAAIENTLSRDGSTPNTMNADLDMNGYAVINHVATSGDLNFSFKGDWTTSTSYVVNNLVYVTTAESATNGGATYICTTGHVSGATFDGDLSSYWTLFSKRGASGAGSGDLLAANNLSDVASASTSRTNLGFTSPILDRYSPGAIGGTTPAAGTFTTFTSTGIDDNATTTVLTLAAGLATFSENLLIEDDNSAANVTLTIDNTNAIGTGSGIVCKHQGTTKGAFGYNAPTGEIVIQGYLGTATRWLSFDTSTGKATFGDDVELNPGGLLTVNRTTEDAAFINFKATADADATSAISTLTTSGAVTHHIQIELNGVTAWIPCSTTDPS